MNKFLTFILILVLIAGAIFLIFYLPNSKEKGKSPPEEPKNPNIVVFSPQKEEAVEFPFTVNGEARVFENTVIIRLKEKTGEILFYGFTSAMSPDIGLFGPFEKEIEYLFKKPQNQEVILDVFTNSPKDGSEIELVSTPIKFNLGETMVVKAFFNNDNLDPEFSCNKVFPIERIIPKTQTPARAALEVLLEGPSVSEREEGFLTNINFGVKIQKLTIESGVAKVDFDDMLEYQIGGSCRVAAISAEITQTLKQFSTVKDVVISINNRTEDILQP